MKQNGKRSVGAHFPRGALPRVSLAGDMATFVAEATSPGALPTVRITERASGPKPTGPGGGIALRDDAPTFAPTRRASSDRLIQALSTSESVIDARRQLDRDKYARSSQGPRAALLRTWARIHESTAQMVQLPKAPFPLREHGIETVLALLKAAGYRSVPNYLSRAKEEHVRLGAEWTRSLDDIARPASRSAQRGIGPARQSAPLDLPALEDLDPISKAFTPNGPMGALDMAIAGSFFLMREIEISLAVSSHVTLQGSGIGLTASWNLPVSKTNPRGDLCVSVWGCPCQRKVGQHKIELCAGHALARKKERLRTKFLEWPEDTLPLFPTVNGTVVEKKEVVLAIEALAKMSGQEVVDSDGASRYGGQSLRVTGAQYLASIVIEILKIQVLARWESDVVLRYVHKAPLAAIVTDVERARLRHTEAEQPKLAIEDIKEEITAKVLAEIKHRSAPLEPPAPPLRVAIRNLATKTFHSAPAERGLLPPRPVAHHLRVEVRLLLIRSVRSGPCGGSTVPQMLWVIWQRVSHVGLVWWAARGRPTIQRGPVSSCCGIVQQLSKSCARRGLVRVGSHLFYT